MSLQSDIKGFVITSAIDVARLAASAFSQPPPADTSHKHAQVFSIGPGRSGVLPSPGGCGSGARARLAFRTLCEDAFESVAPSVGQIPPRFQHRVPPRTTPLGDNRRRPAGAASAICLCARIHDQSQSDPPAINEIKELIYRCSSRHGYQLLPRTSKHHLPNRQRVAARRR